MENQQDVLIELKFLVRGRAFSTARDTLFKQMEENSKHGLSYGVVIMVSDNGKGWFADEKDRILQNENITEVDSAFEGDLFAVGVYRHE